MNPSSALRHAWLRRRLPRPPPAVSTDSPSGLNFYFLFSKSFKWLITNFDVRNRGPKKNLWKNEYKPLLVFLTGDPKQNVNSFMTPVSDSVFNALSHGSLGFVLHGSPINRHCKDSYWLLKNFDQSENGWKSYHGKQNRGYHVKEHKKLNQKMMS